MIFGQNKYTSKIINNFISQTSEDVARYSARDSIIAKVMDYVNNRWQVTSKGYK